MWEWIENHAVQIFICLTPVALYLIVDKIKGWRPDYSDDDWREQ
jgi:hypothetical protein